MYANSRRRNALDDRCQHFLDADAGLAAGTQDLGRIDRQGLLHLGNDHFRARDGQVNLVQHRHDCEIVLHRQIGVGDCLRLHALKRIDKQDAALAGGQAARNLVAEIDVPGRVDQVQLVGLVLVLVIDGHRVHADGDAALALEVHGVQHLRLKLASGDGPGLEQELVGERAFAVIDVGNDREVADQLVRRAHVPSTGERRGVSPTCGSKPGPDSAGHVPDVYQSFRVYRFLLPLNRASAAKSRCKFSQFVRSMTGGARSCRHGKSAKSATSSKGRGKDMTKRILSGGLVAALLLAATTEITAQTYRNRLPTRPASPAPATGSGLLTPSMGGLATPNFATVAPAATPGVSPPFNPSFNATFNPGFNSFNYGFNNFSPYNPGFGGFGFGPFANPYGGFGFNPYFSPYNASFAPGLNPFATPFNPYFGSGMYNPYLGY